MKRKAQGLFIPKAALGRRELALSWLWPRQSEKSLTRTVFLERGTAALTEGAASGCYPEKSEEQPALKGGGGGVF